eukprot:1140406-Pelagomonas_calceolata.AAC.4
MHAHKPTVECLRAHDSGLAPNQKQSTWKPPSCRPSLRSQISAHKRGVHKHAALSVLPKPAAAQAMHQITLGQGAGDGPFDISDLWAASSVQSASQSEAASVQHTLGACAKGG